MGLGTSQEQEDIGLKLRQREKQNRADAEKEKATMAMLDLRTKVPHLLIELRNLGFVEVQGKDTGGIYSRLDDWLRREWRAKLVLWRTSWARSVEAPWSTARGMLCTFWRFR